MESSEAGLKAAKVKVDNKLLTALKGQAAVQLTALPLQDPAKAHLHARQAPNGTEHLVENYNIYVTIAAQRSLDKRIKNAERRKNRK